MSDLGDRIKSAIAQHGGTDLNIVNRILDIIAEDDRQPIPFSEEMAADRLRAAYENYHAERKAIKLRMDLLDEAIGRLAEDAAKVVQAGGEI